MNQIDEKLVEEVAQLWVRGGGDRWGFEYYDVAIADRIEDLNQPDQAGGE